MDPLFSVGVLDTQLLTLGFAPTGLDKNGNVIPAPVSNPAWTLVSGTSVSLTPSSDGTTCQFPVLADGVSVAQLSANPQNSDGTPNTAITLTAQAQITVTAGVAVATALNISTVSIVPAAAPVPAKS